MNASTSDVCSVCIEGLLVVFFNKTLFILNQDLTLIETAGTQTGDISMMAAVSPWQCTKGAFYLGKKCGCTRAALQSPGNILLSSVFLTTITEKGAGKW